MPRSSRRTKNDGDDGEKNLSKKDMKLAKDALRKAVKSGMRDVLNLFGGATSNTNLPVMLKEGISMREQRQILLQTIATLDAEAATEFFEALKQLVITTIEDQAHVPESAFESDDTDEDEQREIVPDARSSQALSFLYYAALCVQSHFNAATTSSKASVLDEAYETAVALHNVLAELDESCGPDAAQPVTAIVSLCENWWMNDGRNKENLIAQALPIIVENARQSLKMKRLYAIREALAVIDFADPESRGFCDLVLRVASSPACLKTPEGKKFLSYLFSLDQSIVSALHASMRAQIPEATKTILKSYGQIYYRAWKEAPDRSFLETEVLQDLMYAAIHVAKDAMVKNILTVLEAFHDNKKNPETEDLLYRMYGPLLWRSLSSANALVRVNAASVLAQVFPLLGGPKTSAVSVQKACASLKALLQDPDPRVRVAGSQAVAVVLTTYWDVVPSGEIRGLLNHLVAEHASDASSSAVRVGSLNAVTKLLEAPQSHAVLRELLPSLGNLIHDKVEKVRLAVVRMLLCVKEAADIKFFHIVPPDHLIARLAEEGRNNPTNAVASSLTALILNSYFPTGPKATALKQVSRTVTFLKNDPDAAAVFYANLAGYLEVDVVCAFAVKLLRCLHNAVKAEQALEKKRARTAQGKRRRFGNSSDEEEETEEEEAESDGLPTAADTELMANLAETICTLWQSIEKQLEKNEACTQFLEEEFSGPTLTNALNFFEAKAANVEVDMDEDDETEEAVNVREQCHRTCAALLRCAGRLPSEQVEGLVSHIFSALSSVQDAGDQSGPVENVTSQIALLCFWGMTEEVASSLALSIKSAFHGDSFFGSPEADSKKRKGGRNRRPSDSIPTVPQLPPSVALGALEDIFRGSDPSSVAAREAIMESESASTTIEKVLEEGTKHAERILSGESVYSQSLSDSDITFLVRVCETFGRLALHKEASTNNGNVSFSEQAAMLLHWTTTTVVPAFNLPDGDPLFHDAPFSDPNISSIHAEKSFDVFPSSPEPAAHRGSRRRVNRNKTPDRLDDGLGPLVDSPSAARGVSGISRAFAVSLLNSSCLLFSEWLAVGGSGGGLIAKGAAEWCQVFVAKEKASKNQSELLPSFCRLAIQLCKTEQDSSLLEKLLTKCSGIMDGPEDTTVVRKALSALFSFRGNSAEAIVSCAVDSILEAAYYLLQNQTEELEFELPDSLATLWSSGDGCIGSAISAILSNKSASLALGKRLAENFSKHAEDSTRIALFDAKCLWVLCDSESKVAAEVTELVRQLNVTGLEEDLGAVVGELIDGVQAS